jgi:hypothetical protein
MIHIFVPVSINDNFQTIAFYPETPQLFGIDHDLYLKSLQLGGIDKMLSESMHEVGTNGERGSKEREGATEG